MVPKSALGKAVYYSLAQKAKLTACLENSNIPLDKYIAENAIRPYVAVRKARLFCDK